MTFFNYRNEELFVEEVSLQQIAQQFGTPSYVYSRAALVSAFENYHKACSQNDHLICYAVKANSNLAILNLFATLGAGFDIVSAGELSRVLAARGDPKKIVFSGIGKTADEIRLALRSNILCFNVESENELLRLNKMATEANTIAPISLRVNPDVDAKTHRYIATGLKRDKFGIAYSEALSLYRKASTLPHIKIKGIDCHIGSNITQIRPIIEALDKLMLLVDKLTNFGITIEHVDVGGGLGIRYKDERPPEITKYVEKIFQRLASRKCKILFEPGRSLVGNAGVLLCKVEYLKQGAKKRFAVVDAAMNDLIRPALYQAWHQILPVHSTKKTKQTYDVVGPICESGDFLGLSRKLGIQEGDFLAVMSAGAYGMSMSSNYNSRPRVAEVMVDRNNAYLIRRRETVKSLYELESLLPEQLTR